jgi:hypothetical protein
MKDLKEVSRHLQALKDSTRLSSLCRWGPALTPHSMLPSNRGSIRSAHQPIPVNYQRWQNTESTSQSRGCPIQGCIQDTATWTQCLLNPLGHKVERLLKAETSTLRITDGRI